MEAKRSATAVIPNQPHDTSDLNASFVDAPTDFATEDQQAVSNTMHYTQAPREATSVTGIGVGMTQARPRIRKRRKPATPPLTQARFIMHEMWEGVVEEMFGSYFVAQIASKTLPDTYESAEIYMTEVSQADKSLLRPGAVFYWAIGYEDRPSGQRVRSSMIRFRRLPAKPVPHTDPWIDSVTERWLKSS